MPHERRAPGRDVTQVPYNADDPRYRDCYSNSSGGARLRLRADHRDLAADAANDVYAAGANGGVWRSTTGGGQLAAAERLSCRP